MTEDQMRAEFEAWAKEEQGLDMHRLPHGAYRSFATHQAWAAWQASSKAVCVELPEEEEHKGVHYDIDYMPTDAVRKALDKAGVRYK